MRNDRWRYCDNRWSAQHAAVLCHRDLVELCLSINERNPGGTLGWVVVELNGSRPSLRLVLVLGKLAEHSLFAELKD
jgi:hypothetical protein